jgi:predicted nicotinamide N-methyase
MAEPEFFNDKERELFARANLGEQLRSFLTTPAGRYLKGRAEADYEAAKEELAEINPYTPWGRRRWRAAQMKLKVADAFTKYCVDALNDAEVAYAELREQEDKNNE